MPDRAVSEILGYSFVFTLVLVSVAFISASGIPSFQNAEQYERQTNAQKAFNVMHNNLEDIYYNGAPSRGTEMDLGETQLGVGDNATINVTVDGVSDSFIIQTRPLVQTFDDDSELVYEGGAVFYSTRDGGVVREEPPMTLREDRVHIIAPNISHRTDRQVGSGTVLVRARLRNQELRYANTTDDTPTDLTINITSERRDLWQEYLTSKGTFDDGDCTTKGDDVVECSVDNLDQVYLVESEVELFFDR